MVNDGAISKKPNHWHTFDGRWYGEAQESTNTIIKREIVRPGERLNVFELGKGPFPLPFGQKKAEILRQFTVKLIAPAADDPKNTDHLACIPKPDTTLDRQFKEVHFYVDQKLDLPVRIRTLSNRGDEETIVDLDASKLRLNTNLSAEKLQLPALPTYAIQTEPLPPPEK
jgi:hypothetical protein